MACAASRHLRWRAALFTGAVVGANLLQVLSQSNLAGALSVHALSVSAFAERLGVACCVVRRVGGIYAR